MQAQPPPLAVPSRNWFERNLKWIIPAICLVAIGAIFGFIALLMGAMKSSDAYLGAITRVKAAPAVIHILGEPIKEGFFVRGNISVSGPSGRAELAIPIAGSNETATIYVEATKSLGIWHFDALVVQVDKTKERIDLSEKETGPNQAEKAQRL